MRQSHVLHRLAIGRAAILQRPSLRVTGKITGLNSLAAQVVGLSQHIGVGEQVVLGTASSGLMMGEVASIQAGVAHVLTFDPLHGLGEGDPVSRAKAGGELHVTDGWLGRVIDPLGRPLDGLGALPVGAVGRKMRASPPPATQRARLGQRLDLGVAALDLFAPCRQGQRLGLFAGSGIGKSTLLASLARFTRCDVVVLALIGERGREVREFLEDDLGQDGLARAVVVVATSDAPPLMRRQAGYTAMAVAEHFRDQGKSVLLLADSITRFCQALREIALAAGEPPATRGFPASVFAELPRLLERAGPGLVGPSLVGPSLVGPGLVGSDESAGQITAFFTVLVEGDDHNEPVADATRGILDGHVILDRKIAEAGRFPPIDVLRSLSRTAPGCLEPAEALLARQARGVLAQYASMADMLRLGAYRMGTDPEVDTAIQLGPRIEALLQQEKGAFLRSAASFAALRSILDGELPQLMTGST